MEIIQQITPNPMTISYQGHKFECEYTFYKGTVSADYDQPDDPDEIEVTKVTILRGQDDISEILADCGWLPEIERLIIEKL